MSAKLLVLLTVPHDSEQPATAMSKNSRICGFAFLSGDPNDPLLEDILVRKDLRGYGCGQLLMRTILASSMAEAAPRIDLYCKHELLGFYSKFGFTLVRGAAGERCLLRRVRIPTANN